MFSQLPDVISLPEPSRAAAAFYQGCASGERRSRSRSMLVLSMLRCAVLIEWQELVPLTLSFQRAAEPSVPQFAVAVSRLHVLQSSPYPDAWMPWAESCVSPARLKASS
jgi:hypothetical protein